MTTRRRTLARRPGPFRIRRASVHDLDLLVRHRRGMFEAMGHRNPRELLDADRVYRRWLRRGFRHRTLVGWIVESASGEPAGSGCVWIRETQPRPVPISQRAPYLLSMFTEPRFRGRGVGHRVVHAAIRWSRDHGFARVLLHAAPMGRRLYRTFGFVRTWEMRLELSPPVARGR